MDHRTLSHQVLSVDWIAQLPIWRMRWGACDRTVCCAVDRRLRRSKFRAAAPHAPAANTRRPARGCEARCVDRHNVRISRISPDGTTMSLPGRSPPP